VGGAKIGPRLRAEGFEVSDATVGRMLAELVARGVVQAMPTVRRCPHARRAAPLRPPLAARSRRDRAQRLVQLDTVFVNLTPTKAIKHFTAYDPIAKWTVGKAFNRASAQAAAAFLDKIVADVPFPVKAIRVDGGSEFMAEFEVACQTKGIALYVLRREARK
jgi:putative transposase